MIEQPKTERKEVPITESKPKGLVAQENLSEIDGPMSLMMNL